MDLQLTEMRRGHCMGYCCQKHITEANETISFLLFILKAILNLIDLLKYAVESSEACIY